MLAYSVEYSLQCQFVSRTIVSTDSQEIAQIALQYGAEAPFIRPKSLAEDSVPDYPFLRHALDTLESQEGKIIDLMVLLRPTSPLRPPGLIERCLDLLEKDPAADSVRSVVKCSEHPYRHWKICGPYMEGVLGEVEEPYSFPRQFLPPIYFQSGDIEVIRRRTLLSGSVSGKKILPLILDREEMLDIDEFCDWKRAEERFMKRGPTGGRGDVQSISGNPSPQ